MNWNTTEGSSATLDAGRRADDADAMAGPAVMYDALAGIVVAVNGSPDYQANSATSNAHLITIRVISSTEQVETPEPMNGRRIFANSIVLPDGTVFVVGGKGYGNPFFDNDSEIIPELWSLDTKVFAQLALGPTPRNYHSIGLLMPDGTVFSVGSRLCGDCGDRNHFDCQLFSPPYLLQDDGMILAFRPRIQGTSTPSAKVGDAFTVTLGSKVERMHDSH